MDKRIVMDFYQAFSFEPGASARTVIDDVITVWGKMDKSVGKNPALIRKGIVLGLGLAEGLRTGKIAPRRTVKPATEKSPPQYQE